MLDLKQYRIYKKNPVVDWLINGLRNDDFYGFERQTGSTISLIELCLMHIPIPTLVFHKESMRLVEEGGMNGHGYYVPQGTFLIGKGFVQAVYDFVIADLPLQNCAFDSEWNGKTWNDLHRSHQRRIIETPLDIHMYEGALAFDALQPIRQYWL